MSSSKLYLYVARFAKYLKHKIFSRLNNMIIKNLFFYQFNFLLVICVSKVVSQGHCQSRRLCMILLAPSFFPPLFDWQEERKRECGKFVLICSTQVPLFLLPNPTPPWFSVLLGHPEGSDHSGVVQHCLEQAVHFYNSAGRCSAVLSGGW